MGSAWAAASPDPPWEKGRLDRAPPGPQGRRLLGIGARCRRGHGPGRHCLHTRYVIPGASGFVPTGVRERCPCCCSSRPREWLPCGCSAGSSPTGGSGGGLALEKGTPAFCSSENGKLPPPRGGQSRILPSFGGSWYPRGCLWGGEEIKPSCRCDKIAGLGHFLRVCVKTEEVGRAFFKDHDGVSCLECAWILHLQVPVTVFTPSFKFPCCGSFHKLWS